MFVFIPGVIPPVRFDPGGKDPAEISIQAVTYLFSRFYPRNSEKEKILNNYANIYREKHRFKLFVSLIKTIFFRYLS